MQFSNDQATVVEQLRLNLRKLAERQPEVLRRAVSVITTGQDYYVRCPSSFQEKKLLACLSWYLPKEISVLVRLELEERASKSEPEQRVRLSCLLSSEPEMILYILESDVLGKNSDEVFGNIRGSQVKFAILPKRAKKPKRTVRHRGYRDKGSLGPESVTREDLARDIGLRDQQMEIERLRKQVEQSIQFCLGFIQ